MDGRLRRLTIRGDGIEGNVACVTVTGGEIRAAWLGRVGYEAGVELQHRVRKELLDRAPGSADTLLLLEHPPTYTVGRNCGLGDVLAETAWLRQRGITVAETDRGGRATYHGPGQLVGYPVIDLSRDRRNVRAYVRDLQEVLVRTLAVFGVSASGGEERERIGVWVGPRKIASIGIHLRRWVTTHGFALNVSTDLTDFAGILSCGFDAGVMTSIEELTGQRPALATVAECCAQRFAEVFGRRLVSAAAEEMCGSAREGQDAVPAPGPAAPAEGRTWRRRQPSQDDTLLERWTAGASGRACEDVGGARMNSEHRSAEGCSPNRQVDGADS